MIPRRKEHEVRSIRFIVRDLFLPQEEAEKAMKVWRVRLLYFLALNAAVQHVTSLEEKRTGSIFGERPVSFHCHGTVEDISV